MTATVIGGSDGIVGKDGRVHRPPPVDIEPIGSRVVIRADAPTVESVAGVLIPESAQEKTTQGVVVAAGPECGYLKVGDRVLFAQYTGADVELDGEQLLIVKEHEVLGRFKPRLT